MYQNMFRKILWKEFAAVTALGAMCVSQQPMLLDSKSKSTSKGFKNDTKFESANKEVQAEEAEPGVKLARRNSMRKQKKHYPYVIVGAGTTAHAAIEGIRQLNPQAEILLLSDEPVLPRFDTESLLTDPISDDLMDTFNEWRRHITSKLENEPDAYSSTPVTLLLGKNDMHFDAEKNLILLQDGTEVHYDKCLIASAGKPRNFYVLDSNRISYSIKDRINTCLTLRDFELLHFLNKRSDISNVTVVGGGFLGTEIACALASNPRNEHIKVQHIFVESAPAGRYLPDYLSNELGKRLENLLNIEVISDRLITSVRNAEDKHANSADRSEKNVVISVMGDTKYKICSDYVILASTHIDPNVQLAVDSNLEIDAKNGGIVVNSQFEALSGLYVAGNAASYYDQALGRRRVDLYDHAVNSGLLAGQNMVRGPKESKIYQHQPMFRSNMAGINVLVEGIGELDSNLKTVGIWMKKKSKIKSNNLTPSPQSSTNSTNSNNSKLNTKKTTTANSEKKDQFMSSVHTANNNAENISGEDVYERGVVYYMRGHKIVGILLWNASDVLENARQLLLQKPEIYNTKKISSLLSIGPSEWLTTKVTEPNGSENSEQ